MIICGDAQEVLKTLESGSIDCVITSPPYWGQRFYGNISEIGSERTPEEYIERLFVVCREIKRVLKKSGTFWLNISDTYYSPSRKRLNGAGSCRIGRHPFLKRKDLCLIPERLVDWLQKDGWYVRSVVIWFKVNSRPESVKDRPVNDYEFLFLLTKSPRYYFKVIREPHKPSSLERIKKPLRTRICEGHALASVKSGSMSKMCHPEGKALRAVWAITVHGDRHYHPAKFPEELCKRAITAGCPPGGVVLDPFCGSGIAGIVAKRLGMQFVGIDLNPDYCKMAEERVNSIIGGLS